MCNGVIPCLPSGLAKSNNIMSMFVLFSWLFGYFESLGFLKMVGQTLYQSIQTRFLVNFLKVQHRRPSHYQEKSIRWSMFICSTSFTLRQHLERQWLRFLQIPGCVLYPLSILHR